MSTYGPAFNEVLDGNRIRGQIATLLEILLSAAECGTWLTLDELHKLTKYPPASISADLRHLRKPAFGRWLVEKRRAPGHSPGLWQYQIQPPKGE